MYMEMTVDEGEKLSSLGNSDERKKKEKKAKRGLKRNVMTTTWMKTQKENLLNCKTKWMR